MSRIKGEVLSQSTHPVGRLVITADFDSAEKVGEFLVPSLSRGDRVYLCCVDFISGECMCGCEAFSEFRNASRMPYRWERAATYPESLARAKGKSILPLISRKPSGLCPHLRKARAWIKRHGLFGHFEAREQWLIQRLEQIPAKTAAA